MQVGPQVLLVATQLVELSVARLAKPHVTGVKVLVVPAPVCLVEESRIAFWANVPVIPWPKLQLRVFFAFLLQAKANGR
jgi:hypothetical protein